MVAEDGPTGALLGADVRDECGVARLINGECLPALGSLDLLHAYASLVYTIIFVSISGTNGCARFDLMPCYYATSSWSSLRRLNAP
jgi:hypothetical protein